VGSGDLKNLNQNSNNVNFIKGALVASSYPHLIQIDKKNNILVAE